MEVKNKVDAYQIVSKLNFENKVKEAKLDDHKEVFTKNNPPAMFLKDNKKHSGHFKKINHK